MLKICRTALYFDLRKKLWCKWTFNSRIRFLSKLHSKSGTVLAVKGVPMGNCIVNIYRNVTSRYIKNAVELWFGKGWHVYWRQILPLPTEEPSIKKRQMDMSGNYLLHSTKNYPKYRSESTLSYWKLVQRQ